LKFVAFESKNNKNILKMKFVIVIVAAFLVLESCCFVVPDQEQTVVNVNDKVLSSNNEPVELKRTKRGCGK